MDTEQSSTGRDKIVSDLKLVIKDAEELLKSTGQQMDSGYQSARARFESTLQNAKLGLDNVQGKVTVSTKDAVETTSRYVQENPWQSVGVGAVAGLVIGLLLGRK
jgi:ElaB/YqjD/DUF883 family membrane-anchored ribosome-binding protein